MGRSSTLTITLTTPPPVKVATVLTLAIDTTTRYVPIDLHFTATLKDIYGNPLNAKTIDLYENEVKMIPKTTNSAGVAEFTIYRAVTGTFNYYAVFAGDANYEGCEAEESKAQQPPQEEEAW